MIIEKAGSNLLFRFAALSGNPGLVHAVVARDGGFSRPPFDGCNASLGVGDDPEAVKAGDLRDMVRGQGFGAELVGL